MMVVVCVCVSLSVTSKIGHLMVISRSKFG